jgi:hypothetical protein
VNKKEQNKKKRRYNNKKRTRGAIRLAKKGVSLASVISSPMLADCWLAAQTSL